jgi:flagellar biosynthetic protein FliP|nr:MAG: flagellar biosynthetic protein FliP [Bacteroidota bacterium]
MRRLCIVLLFSVLVPTAMRAQDSPAPFSPLPQTLPRIQFSVQPADGREDYALPIQLILLLTVLTLAPSIIIMTTSFTRLVVVFHLLRMALGTQQSPPNQVLIGLALFLTLFVMYPALQEINTQALQPYLGRQITQSEALERAARPLKEFMLRQTRAKDLLLFMDLARMAPVQDPMQVPLHVLIPAFLISELRIAFQIGFLLYLPFLVIDLVVSSVLLSMGMMFLPPVMISLPFKLLVFVLTDGWYLIVGSMLRGFQG